MNTRLVNARAGRRWEALATSPRWSRTALRTLFVLLLLVFCVLPARAEDQPDSTQALVRSVLLDRPGTKISGYPYAYYTPETQLAVGVGGIATFYTAESAVLRPSKLTLSGYYTTNKQYKLSLGTKLFLSRNRHVLDLNGSYGFYVDKFWGVGNDTPDLGLEQYESKGWSFDTDLLVPTVIDWGKNVRFGFIYHFRWDEITDRKDNTNLLVGGVEGSEGGTVSGLGIQWNWDSRDSVFYPTHGVYSEFSMRFQGSLLGSTYDFQYFELDLRKYLSIGEEQILAFQGLAEAAAGHPPFYELPALGGSQLLRGYFQGRYRDRLYFAFQVESRRPLWRRFGWVAFAGLGEVAHDVNDLQWNLIRYSYGIGLRWVFDKGQHVNLRGDLGIQPDGTAVYFGLEEAF